MDDAVFAADGHTYQRAAIAEWIARKQAGEGEGKRRGIVDVCCHPP
jgi:hypothetical protein